MIGIRWRRKLGRSAVGADGTSARGDTGSPSGRKSATRSKPRVRKSINIGLVALIAGGVVGGLAQVRLDTRTDSFLPADTPALEAMNEKARSFGGDPIAVLAESERPTQLLGGEGAAAKLLKLEGALAELPGAAAVYGPGTVVNQVAASAQGLVAQVAGRRDALRNEVKQRALDAGKPPQQAQAEAKQAVDAFNVRYGSLLVQGLPTGLPTLRNPQFVRNVIYDERLQPRPRWEYLVPNSHAVGILVRPRAGLDQEATQRLANQVRQAVSDADLDTRRVTISGLPALTSSLASTVKSEMPLLGALAAIGVAASLLTVRWLGRRRLKRLWPLGVSTVGVGVVTATFGWLGTPMSLGVLAVLPILLGLGCGYPLYLAQRPVRRRRVAVAALASASAAAALTFSPLPFVAELGVALAAGILVTAGLALALGPRLGVSHVDQVTGRAADIGSSWVPRGYRRVAVLVAAVAVAGVGWATLPGMTVETRAENLVHGLPAVNDARHIEQAMGADSEIAVSVRGDLRTAEGFKWARSVNDFVVRNYGDQMRPIINLPTLLDFLGESPTTKQILAGSELLPDYLTSSVVRPDGKQSVMIYGTSFGDLDKQRELLSQLREKLPRPPDGMSVDVVGLPVAAVAGYELVSDDRLLVNLVGIAAASVVLAVGLRRRIDAGRALLAAALSGGWGLAVLWLSGAPLSPLTVTLGSLATVTACEFTVLVLDARRSARPWLFRAAVVACVVSAIGYLVLVASELSFLREFGLMLAATVALSMVAAFTVGAVLPPRIERDPAREPALPVSRPSPKPRTQEKVVHGQDVVGGGQ